MLQESAKKCPSQRIHVNNDGAKLLKKESFRKTHEYCDGISALDPRRPEKMIDMVRWHMKGFHFQCIDKNKELKQKNGSPLKL